MSSVFKNRKIHSIYGILFQVTAFIIGAFGLCQLIESFFYSFTEYDMLQNPSFIGFENYSNLFKDAVIRECLGNTVVMVCSVTVLLLLTAILPAVFIAKLKLPFGIGVMVAFSIISVSIMLPGFLNAFFSGDAYGIFNSILLSNSVIDEPIIFQQSYGMLLAIIIMWLYCLAPVFSITYVAVRMKRGFLGTAVVVCAIPVLIYNGGSIITKYSDDWLYAIFNEHLTVRYNIGFAYAILFVGLIMLICWCFIVCCATYGCRRLCKKVKFNSFNFKVYGYITFSLALLLLFAVLSCLVLYFLKAFMPLEELFVFPNFIPKNPTSQNFSYLAESTSSFSIPFSRYLLNSLFFVPLVTIPICFYVALPSGVGFGLFKAFKQQKLLLLCFIPFLFVSGYITFCKLGIINSYFTYMFEFLSSLELLIAVFLVYLAVKLVFYNLKPRVSGIILGSFFVLSSFYAIGAIRGIWYNSGSNIYDERLRVWRDISGYLSSGGVARYGITAANDILMLLATLAVVIIPLILLLILYLLYRRNTKNLTTKEKK